MSSRRNRKDPGDQQEKWGSSPKSAVNCSSRNLIKQFPVLWKQYCQVISGYQLFPPKIVPTKFVCIILCVIFGVVATARFIEEMPAALIKPVTLTFSFFNFSPQF